MNNEYLLHSHLYLQTTETLIHTVEARIHTLDEFYQLLMVVGGHLSIMDWWYRVFAVRHVS